MGPSAKNLLPNERQREALGTTRDELDDDIDIIRVAGDILSDNNLGDFKARIETYYRIK